MEQRGLEAFSRRDARTGRSPGLYINFNKSIAGIFSLAIVMSKKPFFGFTCGAFDLTHAGHYLMFQDCKKNCEFLIVGLQTDPSIDRPWKHKPVQSLEERMIQLKACKYIDKIIVYEREFELFNILKELKIDVRFLGEDWKGKNFTGKELPIEIIYNVRDHGFSSSSLRDRIYNAEKNLKEK